MPQQVGEPGDREEFGCRAIAIVDYRHRGNRSEALDVCRPPARLGCGAGKLAKVCGLFCRH